MTPEALDWRQAFRDADALPQAATPAEKAARGRKFEKILSAMFDESGLQSRLTYRPPGEEIDGSIWLHGRTVLVEAKWTDSPHPASSIYQFKGKVDGKLTGTLGIFISINGFSKDSVDALVAGKDLNIILADGEDIRAIVDGDISVIDALQRKLRAAGDAGTPFLPLVVSQGSASTHAGHHYVIVEAPIDMRFLGSVRRSFGVTSEVKFVPAAGPMNMAPLIRFILEIDTVSSVTAIVDGDLNGRFVDSLRRDLISLAAERGVRGEVIVVSPDLETALGLAHSDMALRDRRKFLGLPVDQLDALISPVDLVKRAKEDPALDSVLRVIGVDTSRA